MKPRLYPLLLFTFTLLAPVAGAQVIWEENFDALPNGTQQHPSGKWTTQAGSCDNDDPPWNEDENYWGVYNGRFRVNDMEGQTCVGDGGCEDNYWTSEEIDISAYPTVSIHAEVYFEGGDFEWDGGCDNSSDRVEFYYSTNSGSTWNIFAGYYAAQEGDIDTGCIEVSGASTIMIRFMAGNKAGHENYYIDNIQLEAGSQCGGCPSSIIDENSTLLTDMSCAGANDGAIDVMITAGAYPFAYSWDHGPATQDVAGLTPASYTLTVVDANNCRDSATWTVTTATRYSEVIDNQAICLGEQAELAAYNGNSYVWEPGDDFDVIYVSPNTDTWYYVTVSKAPCVDEYDSVLVSVNPLPTATATGTDSLCAGGQISLYGQPAGMSSYNWSGPGGFSSAARDTTRDSISAALGGSYTLRVSDANGCQDAATHTVNVLSSPNLSLSSSDSLYCKESPIELTASGADSYIWSTGATGDSISQSISQSTTYYVTGSSSSGCTATDSISVTYERVLGVISGGGTICPGDVAQIYFEMTGTGPWDLYYQHNGITDSLKDMSSSPVSIIAPDTGSYSLQRIATDACQGSTAGQAHVQELAMTAPDIADTAFCQSEINKALYSGELNIRWYTDLAQEWVDTGLIYSPGDNLAPGSYSYYARRYAGSETSYCESDADTIALTVWANPQADTSLYAETYTTVKGTSLQLYAGVLDESGEYNYSWSNPTNLNAADMQNPTIDAVSADQSYQVTITNADNGCQSIAGPYYVSTELPEIHIYNLITPNEDDFNDYLTIDNMEIYDRIAITIYNRYGQQVYSIENYKSEDPGWYGQYENTELSAGVYFYLVTTYPGEKQYKGSITILK